MQKHAMQAWETEGDFRAAVEADEKILSYLSIEQIHEAFSLDRHLLTWTGSSPGCSAKTIFKINSLTWS